MGKCDDAIVRSLTLWARPEPAPQSLGPLILWQEFLPAEAPDNWYSLPELVNRDRESLRAAYLAWVHEVGVRMHRGRSLRDRLQIRPGLSYWWTTIPADSSLEPGSPVYATVRLMALTRLVVELGVEEIELATGDDVLKFIGGSAAGGANP